MTDQSIPLHDDNPTVDRPIIEGTRPTRAAPRMAAQTEAVVPGERRRGFLATLDPPIVIIVGILLAIGMMMVYSTTFDWSYQEFGSESLIFMRHIRNLGYGAVVAIVLVVVDYRVWKKWWVAVLLLLGTITLLVGVLLFGDNTFGARRSFFNGSYQPGELAELIIIMYMAAWLGSKRARIRSLTQGLLPFLFLVGVMVLLVLRQPDISTAAMIFGVAFIMFFLAGASILQLGAVIAMMGAGGIFLVQRLGYAQDRVSSYLASVTDITQANYHVLQAVIAFENGGWTGVGLGQGRQKFGFLPAPHTDSIFAVIGEELGLIGATVVIALYVALMVRGFQISRRSQDPFGALMAAGITIWVVAKALLNVAVMTNALPATGAPLPFISFGGSSLVVMMAGAGLLLSVARVSAREGLPERKRTSSANHDISRGHRRPHSSATKRRS